MNNKKALYESIMKSVSKQVKKALNESFENYMVCDKQSKYAIELYIERNANEIFNSLMKDFESIRHNDLAVEPDEYNRKVSIYIEDIEINDILGTIDGNLNYEIVYKTAYDKYEGQFDTCEPLEVNLASYEIYFIDKNHNEYKIYLKEEDID